MITALKMAQRSTVSDPLASALVLWQAENYSGSGAWLDEVGAVDLTKSSGVSFDTANIEWDFDGTANAVMTATDPNTLDFAGSFTVAIRARVSAVNDRDLLVSKRATTGTTAGWLLQVRGDIDDKAMFSVHDGSAGASPTSTGTVTAGQSFTMIGWVDRATNMCYVDLDGTVGTGVSVATLGSLANSTNLVVGNVGTPTSAAALGGAVRNLAVWDRVLTAGERAALRTTWTTGGAVAPYALAAFEAIGWETVTSTTEWGSWTLAHALHAAVYLDHADRSALSDALYGLRLAGGGWGDYNARDAFGDGSVNPITTPYAPNTAWIGHAFWCNGDTARANQAADDLLDLFWDGTSFRYSSTAADQAYRVWNVDALSIALLHRLGREAAIVSQVKADIEAERGSYGGLAWNWPYWTPNANDENDLSHFAWVGWGLDIVGSTYESLSELWTRFYWSSGIAKIRYDSSVVTTGSHHGLGLMALTYQGDANEATAYNAVVASMDETGGSTRVTTAGQQAMIACGLAFSEANGVIPP